MSGWQALGVAAAALVLLILAGILVAGFVAAVRDIRAQQRRPAPVAPPRDVDLDRVPPLAGVLAAWISDYAGADIGDLVAARDEVRRVMPALGAQLDRLGDIYRDRGPGRPPHPCVVGGHLFGRPLEGVRACAVCGQVV